MSVFMTLIEHSESEPVFKAALRTASGEQIRGAIEYLEGTGGAERKLGRLRAALRRLEFRKKHPGTE